MNVTFILPGWSTSPIGGYKVVYEYANRLAVRGHRVSVVHPLDLAGVRSVVWRKYIHFRRYVGALARERWIRLEPSIRFLVTPTAQERYIPDGDCVIATAWETADSVYGYTARKGKKFYFAQHYETWSGDKQQVDRTLRLDMNKIANSKWLQSVIESLGASAAWIPCGIDSDVFRIIRRIEDRDRFSIGMLYHEAAWKGFDDGLQALSLVRERHPEVSLKLFGVFARRKGLPEWVDYARNPSSADLVRLYNSMSIFVHTSWFEGWGLTPAEAMACGCAVAATDSKGILDYAEHDVNALISPPQEPDKLAKHILRLIEDDQKRTSLAWAGHERIREFTWARSAALFENALASAGGGQ